MSMKRRSRSLSSSSDSEYEAKRTRLGGPGLFNNIKLFLIQTKIEPSELDLLYTLAESNGADINSTIEDADVVVTRISMRKRLERHLKWDLAKQKAIVTPAWITHSVSQKECLPCGKYAAFCSLEDCTKQHCPDHNPQASSSSPVSTSPPPLSYKNVTHMSRFAVQRLSPLVCPNQALLARLNVIRDARWLEGDARSAMSYSRSIASLKAYPKQIKSAEQVADIPFVGPKILSMIRQYTSSGQIEESTRMSESPRYHCLAAFSRIYGIGPSKARELYDSGCRTYEDLDRRFGAEYGRDVSAATALETAGIRTMLELRDDLSVPMFREEVEEIARVIAQELEKIEPGCRHTICGGYRRGKMHCNDVDFIFTHPQSGKDRDLCKKLVTRLHTNGLVTHVLHLSSFRSTNPIHKASGDSKPDSTHWDTLDKSLAVFRLPEGTPGAARRLHRRVDLICSPIETYWTAVVGWTGSTMFERDLRLWAKQKMGLKFDSSGITRRRDTRPFYPQSEHAVFEVLGLEWIDPTMRNADL